jgi:hypothetical protein
MVPILALHATIAYSEEGFWSFTNPPTRAMKRQYGFAPSRLLLDHLMKSAARFDSGGNSGAFVSADGLWLTNNHIGAYFVAAVRDKWPQIEIEGFYAPTPEKELRLPDSFGGIKIRIATVEAVEDVTRQIRAVGIDKNARKLIISKLEQAATDRNHRGQVTKLFGGARYQLQKLRIYSDIRLVFIPEQRIGSFDDNGDGLSPDWPDSFNLDVSIFRVYDKGKPVRPKHFLAWSLMAPKAGDLVMAAGTPVATFRNRPVAHVAFERDVAKPLEADMQRRLQLALIDLAHGEKETGPRLARRIIRKDKDRRYAEYRLSEHQDSRLLGASSSVEQLVRGRFPPVKAAYDRLDLAVAELAQIYPRAFLLSRQPGFGSVLLDSASQLIRSKAIGVPLDLGREDFDPALERARLTAWLKMLADRLGYEDPVVQAVLDGRQPSERAAAIVRDTALGDPERRKALAKGRRPPASDDPALKLARAIDFDARRVGDRVDALMDIIGAAEDEIEQARYGALGDNAAPEADNNLRFAYGTVAGYQELGRKIPYMSTFGQLYRYYDNQQRSDPLTLPKRWIEGRQRLNSGMQLNFATTIDAVPGTSGTPIVNSKGQFVGVINSGNFGEAAASYFYNSDTGRSIGISATGIIEALRRLYGACNLADELIKGRRASSVSSCFDRL